LKYTVVTFAIALASVATALPSLAQAPPGLRSEAILDHLNAVINWYRGTTSRVPTVGLPSDAVYQMNAQNLASQAVQLAFQSAEAEAALIPASSPAGVQNTAGGSSQQNPAKMLNDVNARISALQAQVSDLDQQMTHVPKAKRQQLMMQKESAQGELELRNATRQALEQLAQFISNNGEIGRGGLEGSITELRHSVPELANLNSGKTAAKPLTGNPSAPASSGLIGEVVAIYDLLSGMHQVSQMAQETARVRDAANNLHNPLVATLRATIQQGEQLANAASQTSNQGPNPPGQPLPVDQQRKQFEALAARFKQIASASLPLSQEIILLDQASSNFLEWRQSLVHESNRILRSVVFRVLGIALAMGVILLLSEIWRRVTFRYVTDMRRRRQFLALRRIVMGFCMGIVLILGFVSEFSSLATFAGFITAGLAVGLQTILLSVAAYFFLVGRWGIRVGDRISVAGVTGDVIDVGLVRLYLMEQAGTGVDLFPTGRIVVFSNSVLFQATTPLFKQLPGAEYAWHEVAVILNPAGKINLVETQLLDAVNAVHADYRNELQRQLGTTERRIDFQLKVPEPHGQLQYGDTGLEYVVRYPVALRQVHEVDDRITRGLLEILQQQPELQASVTGLPRIRAAVKG
jgi:small-conductance mechanosensitive channel